MKKIQIQNKATFSDRKDKTVRKQENEEDIKESIDKHNDKKIITKLKIRIQKYENQLRTLQSINFKLKQQLRAKEEDVVSLNQYISKLEQQLLKKTNKIDTKLKYDFSELEQKLRQKQKQMEGLQVYQKRYEDIKAQNQIFKRFINKGAKNVSHQLLTLETKNLELERKIIEYEFICGEAVMSKQNKKSVEIKQIMSIIKQYLPELVSW